MFAQSNENAGGLVATCTADATPPSDVKGCPGE
jgi:hypothetical protein